MKYEKMNDCFESINTKLQYSLSNSNLKEIFNILECIKTPTLVTGVGGSSIVATFLAKVLREKNKIIATYVSSRDIAYMNLDQYENIICVSYSGKNIGVDISFNNNLIKYLFTGNPKDNIKNICYKMLPEISYVSINATIIPLSILFLYYRYDIELLNQIINSQIHTHSHNHQYEVLSGYETITASTLLESCIIESGIGSCIVHDKYNYCHGRINAIKNMQSDLILFDTKNELDELYKNKMKQFYKEIIIIERQYQDHVINDYYSAIISLKLIKEIASNLNIDISDMKELPDNDLFYRYKGKIRSS